MWAKSKAAGDVIHVSTDALFEPFKRVWNAYRKQQAREKAISDLRAMDDRMLRDIGIPRGEIRYMVMTGRPRQ